MTSARNRLLAVYEDVERRTRATNDSHDWWPCRRGCDTCCHRLAEIPRMVRAEWELLREGLDLLSPEARAEVDARIAALARAEQHGSLPRHVVCPMLDEEEGACRVYAHRPAACRTYGFYVERGLGLHCEIITEAVAARAPEAEPIVWGNQEGVDGALARLPGTTAAPLPLTAWVLSSSSVSPPDDPPEAPPDPSSPSSVM
jgi:Fe-S-cluster containining protein